MRANLFKHHSIMQECCGRWRTVIGSYVFGSICGAEGSQAVSAVLMDRAEMGNVAQQLMQRPRTRPGLGWRQAYAVVSEVVFGMADMHDAGWAHLDIKPANIVISRHVGEEGVGAFSHHSLIDFGSSVRLGTLDHLTLNVPGTRQIISPEWRNSNVVGYKADIWAVGALLLELRAGRALSDDLLRGLMQQSSHASTLAAMRQSAVYKHLKEDEWACVTACLTYEHTERPDVDELLEMAYLKHWQ
jgi:serine/threonine protein kinase